MRGPDERIAVALVAQTGHLQASVESELLERDAEALAWNAQRVARLGGLCDSLRTRGDTVHRPQQQQSLQDARARSARSRTPC